MFVPNDFKETRTSEINDLVQKFLTCIVANTTQGLIASHIPLVMKDDQILVGIGNDQ
jgi:transcriptional regulator